MPLHLYPDVYASGSVPPGWVPTKGGTLKYPVRNPAVRQYLRQLLPGRWQKVIKQGHSGEVHYFEHTSGQVVAPHLPVVTTPPCHQALARRCRTPPLLGWCPARRGERPRQACLHGPTVVGDARGHSGENGAFSSGASRSLWINFNHLQMLINWACYFTR